MTETAHHHRPTLKQASKGKIIVSCLPLTIPAEKQAFQVKTCNKKLFEGGGERCVDPCSARGLISHRRSGRTHRDSPKANSAANVAAQLRTNRRNSAKQAQIKKRQSLVSATRIFSGIDGAPRVVAIVPLAEDVKARDVSARLAQAIDGTLEEDTGSGLQKLRCD